MSRSRLRCAPATSSSSPARCRSATDGKIVEGGIGAQTKKVLENVSAALALAGCELSDVVKTTVWLKHAEDFAGFNAAYAPFFPDNPPARSTAESRLMIDILVEIEAIAYKPLR